VAAADRSAAGDDAERLCAALGARPVFYQMSGADVRKNRAGTRTYFWAKDLPVDPRDHAYAEGDVDVIIDVDGYVDMNGRLTEHVIPHLVYTFQPKAAAYAQGDTSYCFQADGTVDYRVGGGGHYRHGVWDYGRDELMVTRRCFGFPTSAAAYLVDRRSASPHHDLVLLTPLASWSWMSAWYATWCLGQTPLRRFAPVQDGFVRMTLQTPEGLMRSTAEVGSHNSITIPAAVDDAIAQVAQTSKQDLTLASILGYTSGTAMPVPEARVAAMSLLKYFRKVVPAPGPVVFPASESVRTYAFQPFEHVEPLKPSMIAFMSPLVHGCFAPAVCVANEQQMVDERILKVASDAVPTPKLARYMDEFIQYLFPVAHELHPVDLDEVFERQGRPTQRRILEQADTELPQRINKLFMKKEAYQKPADPRAISQINGPDKRDYSQYIYAIQPHIEAKVWYAFGKTPALIAQRVANIASAAASHVLNADAARCDGRTSAVSRELEKRLTMWAFHTDYHEHLLDKQVAQFGLKGVTALGVKFQGRFQRCSGSGETAMFNGVTVAFIIYTALRDMGYDHLQATEFMDRFVFVAGDDSVVGDVSVTALEKAAELVGQLFEVGLVRRGEIGIEFLARRYGPDVWFGDPTSCCDIARTVTKFHATVALPSTVTPAMKLAEKAYSLRLSDGATPFIGEYVTLACEVLAPPPLACATAELRPWVVQQHGFAAEVQYPNRFQEWMVDLLRAQLPTFSPRLFENYLAEVRRTQQKRGSEAAVALLLTPPLCADTPEPAVKAPVVVGSELVLPAVTPKVEVPRPRSRPEAGRGRGRGGHATRGRGRK